MYIKYGFRNISSALCGVGDGGGGREGGHGVGQQAEKHFQQAAKQLYNIYLINKLFVWVRTLN